MKNWCVKNPDKANLIWRIGCFCLAVAMWLPVYLGGAPGVIVGLLMLSLWLILGREILSHWYQEDYLRTLRALDEDCDPEPMLERIRGLKRHRSPDAYTASLWLAEGMALSCLGRQEEALEAYERAQTDHLTSPYWVYAVTKQINRGTALFSLGRHRDARWAWTQGLAEFQTQTPERRAKSGMQDSIQTIDCELRIAEGRLDGVEEELRSLLSSAAGERQRVGLHMMLGRLYLAQNCKGYARPEFAYVADHGGKFHQQREAEELLKTLQIR